MTRAAVWPDLLVGLFVLVLGALALWQAFAIPVTPLYAQVGPRVVPYLVAAGLLALGAALSLVALRGGWSSTLAELEDAPPINRRALSLMAAGMLANLAFIEPFGFSIAATAQFVLTAMAFGSRNIVRDLALALVLTLAVWFLFVEALGVNIGAGVAEGLVLRGLGREVP